MESAHKINSSQRVYCHFHPDAQLIDDYDSGDIICPLCGLVVVDRMTNVIIDCASFTNENRKLIAARVGLPENQLLNDYTNLGTMMNRRKRMNGDSDAEKLNSYAQYQSISESDRYLIMAFREISAMANRVHLPKAIVSRSQHLFKKIARMDCLKGQSMDARISACLYIACRQEKCTRTFKEVCAISAVSKKEIGRCFKLITKSIPAIVEMTSTTEFISRFCGKLDLPRTVERITLHIVHKINELDLLPGRSTVSVAAATIYMASLTSGCRRHVNDVSVVCGVSKCTINRIYRILYAQMEYLLPKKLLTE